MLHILRRPEVMSLTGLKASAIDVLEKRGDFPQRVRISERATGWRSDELEAWIRSRPLAKDVDSDNGVQLRAISTADRRKGSEVRALRARERARGAP